MANPISGLGSPAEAQVKLTKEQFTSKVIELTLDTIGREEKTKYDQLTTQRKNLYGKMVKKREKLTGNHPYKKKEVKNLKKDIEADTKDLQKIEKQTNKIAVEIAQLKTDSAVLADGLFKCLIPVQAKGSGNAAASSPPFNFDNNLMPKGFFKPIVSTAKIAGKVFLKIIKKLGSQLWEESEQVLKDAIKKEIKKIKKLAEDEVTKITENVIGLLTNAGQYSGIPQKPQG